MTNATADFASNTTADGGIPRWRRWLILFILLTGGIKTTLAFTTVVPVLQLIAEHYKTNTDSVLSAQFVLTMGPMGMVLAGLVSGWLVERGGLRRTLCLALAVSTVAGLAQLVIEPFPLLLADRFLLGFAVVTGDVAMTAILAAQFTGAARSRIIGIRQAISSTGTVTTMLAAGWLAQHYGWRAPSFMFVLPLFMLILCFIAFDRPIEPAREAITRERFRILDLWPLLVLSLLLSVAHTMPWFQMPFLLHEHGVTNAILVSRVPALSSFVSILAAMAFGYIYGASGRFTLVAATFCMAIGFIGISIAPSYDVILLCVVIEGMGAGLIMPYFQARILDRVSPAQRGRAIGYLVSAQFLGHFVNPIVTAPLRRWAGLAETFLLAGLLMMALAIGLAIAARAARHQSIAAPG
jgi:MFS family permease